MLEKYFSAPKTLRRLRSGITGPHIDAFASVLERNGYAPASAVRYIRAAAHLGCFVHRRCGVLEDIDFKTLDSFGRHLRQCRCDHFKGSGANTTRIGDDGQMSGFVALEDLFKGRHFDREIVVLCVRWYLSFKLSFRDLVEMMGERGVGMAHTTILRWVQRYLPEFEKRWRRYARPVGGSWKMDETYIKVGGQWAYLYRAVDKAGQTVDFFLSRNRDVNAAKSFLRSAVKNTRVPTKITLDAYAASHRAVREMKQESELPCRVKVRSSQYLNNLIEQDHRRVKQRIRPMLGFKRFDNAVVTISGIELAEKIKKGQFKTGKLGRKATMTELWSAALAA